MTRYTAAAIVAEARMRIDALPVGSRIVVLEGSEDRGILSAAVPLDRMITAGGKALALEAYELLKPEEHNRVAFIVDCDYDVPAGRLRGSKNLIVTRYPAMETDIVALGAMTHVLRELLPGRVDSKKGLEQLTAQVVDRAVELAERLGRIRHSAAIFREKVRFDRLQSEKYWKKTHDSDDSTELVRLLFNQSNGLTVSQDELRAAALAAPAGLTVCSGHDLVRAIATVLHEEYGVTARRLETLPEMLRLASINVIDDLEVVVRLRRWMTTASPDQSPAS